MTERSKPLRHDDSADSPKGADSSRVKPVTHVSGYGSCRCGAEWTGYRTCHCAAKGCHQTFTCISAFDAHRRHGQCLDPAGAGLVPVTKPHWTGWGWPSSAYDHETRRGDE